MSDSLGAKLKKIRLEKGLSLEEAHKKTKIHPDVLRAIEEDSLINVNPVYIKGFLKIYCQFLGVDARDCMPSYKEQQSVATSEAGVTQEKKVAPVLRSATIKFSILKKINFKKIIVIAVALTLGVLVLRGIFNLGKFVAAKYAAAKEKKAVALAAIPLKKAKKAAATSVKVQEKVIPATIVRLGISAKEDCWLQVKVDGKTTFQRVLKKGRFESWEAKEKIEFSLGNAGATVIEVNGQPIPALGRRGQSVKNIVITKEGLNTGR